jgi:hypothetical protein
MTRVRSCLKTRCMSGPRRLFEQQTAAKHYENCYSEGTMQSTSFCDSNTVRPTSQLLHKARGDDVLGHKAVHAHNSVVFRRVREKG